MRAFGAPLALAACLLVNGCGTMVCRVNVLVGDPAESHLADRSFFGAYPFSAVAVDVLGIGSALSDEFEVDPGTGVFYAFVCLISVPVDLVVDAVLLPADLVAWAFGHKKPWFSPEEAGEAPSGGADGGTGGQVVE